VQLQHADVYDRLTPKGRKPSLSTLVITQLISGLWHGIFPGYALFFISCAFFFNSSKASWGCTYETPAVTAPNLYFVRQCPFIEEKMQTLARHAAQVLYRYERTWSSGVQNNLLWRLLKLLYTELTLQYLGTAFMVGLASSACITLHC